MKIDKFKGIIPALVTPLNQDNTIKEKETRELLELELSLGADGFYICGATGEGVVMQTESRKHMCEICVDQMKGKLPVIAHIAAIDATTSIDLAKHAYSTGADAIASIPPFYFNYTEDDIISYYKTLAAAVDMPVMIYYIPRGGVSMSAKTVARIFKEIENVTAVKWSSTDFFEMMKVMDLTNGDINLINGPDELLICGLAAGADGGIGSTYNVMLPLYKDIYNEFLKGDYKTARDIQFKANKVTDILIEENVISSVKELLALSGINVGYSTFPMRRFSKEESDNLLKKVQSVGWEFVK